MMSSLVIGLPFCAAKTQLSFMIHRPFMTVEPGAGPVQTPEARTRGAAACRKQRRVAEEDDGDGDGEREEDRAKLLWASAASPRVGSSSSLPPLSLSTRYRKHHRCNEYLESLRAVKAKHGAEQCVHRRAVLLQALVETVSSDSIDVRVL